MIKLTGYLTGFSSRSDGSAGIRFATQELGSNDFAELQKMLNAFGYIVFKENEITLEDLPKEDAEDKSKTPSKRLRASLYVLHQQLGSKKDFDQFYKEQMDVIIEKVKSHLD